DMVSKALAFGFEPMWNSSVGSLSGARTLEELVDGMIEVLKRNLQENPDLPLCSLRCGSAAGGATR
ncbi:MAG TPA: hypothetical protein VFA15_09440, partial [Nitrososphaera sp.]|nr:hypothetical protein [Nitrososphaera sp.]